MNRCTFLKQTAALIASAAVPIPALPAELPEETAGLTLHDLDRIKAAAKKHVLLAADGYYSLAMSPAAFEELERSGAWTSLP